MTADTMRRRGGLAATSVVRTVSSRVGHTTLRSSNCDSTRYSRVARPAFVKAPTTTHPARPATSTPKRATPDQSENQ